MSKSHCFICTRLVTEQEECNAVGQMNITNEEDSSKSEYKGDKGLSDFQGLRNEHSGTHKTLNEHKLYLDSCATYNLFFIKKILDHIGDSDVLVHGLCNADMTIISHEGLHVVWKVWINVQ